MYVFLLRPVRESGGVKGCSCRPDLGPDSLERQKVGRMLRLQRTCISAPLAAPHLELAREQNKQY